MKYKGFLKLTIQIALLSISMMAISFFTETQIWIDYFNTYKPARVYSSGIEYEGGYYWNYRGWVYSLTGTAYFVMSVLRIVDSHDTEDFKRTTED